MAPLAKYWGGAGPPAPRIDAPGQHVHSGTEHASFFLTEWFLTCGGVKECYTRVRAFIASQLPRENDCIRPQPTQATRVSN